MTSALSANKLKYGFVPKGRDVITFGDMGDKFYISLSGSVGVLIPVSKDSRQQIMIKLANKEDKRLSKIHVIKIEKQKSLKDEQESEEAEISDDISEHDSFEEDMHNYNEVAILPTGESFGELALISNKPRAATIRAKEDCHFAVLEKSDYQKVYGVIQEKILNRKV